jgi:hypothetical protein
MSDDFAVGNKMLKGVEEPTHRWLSPKNTCLHLKSNGTSSFFWICGGFASPWSKSSLKISISPEEKCLYTSKKENFVWYIQKFSKRLGG